MSEELKQKNEWKNVKLTSAQMVCTGRVVVVVSKSIVGAE